MSEIARCHNCEHIVDDVKIVCRHCDAELTVSEEENGTTFLGGMVLVVGAGLALFISGLLIGTFLIAR
jgi:RNA polymerase subunit RPABC4/transcription elongation factor Spt4